jgi:predicted peroxiredoxin
MRSALMFASLAAVSGHRTVLYCIQGAVDVMVRGALERQEGPEARLPTISQRLREALEAGVEVLCCSQTVANKDLKQGDFIEGVEISGAMNLIHLGDRAMGMLSF